MKLVAIAIATLALSLSVQAAPGHGGGGHMGGGHMGGGHMGGGHGGGFGGGHHGGGHIGGGHHGGGRWGGGVWYPAPSYPGTCGWDGYYCHDTYVGGVDCAPQQVEGNVSVTEKTLNALAATPAFATAKTFKAELSQVAAIKDAGEKAQAYLQLAGIDSNDKSAVAAFIGSRDAKGSWVTDLQRNADLSNVQAETLALQLQTALRGNLQ